MNENPRMKSPIGVSNENMCMIYMAYIGKINIKAGLGIVTLIEFVRTYTYSKKRK